MQPEQDSWTVAALTQRIAATLEGFGPVSVRGELSQAKVYPSGHLYATLKDQDAVLSLVMWRSQVVRNGPLPREGQQVLVRGSLAVYPPRGQYQLQATRITVLGAGDLAARFEELKARLRAEGLFAEERKRPLPVLPRAVGLATAAGSAALADMLHSIRARFPRMPVVHAPCLVQGAAAPASIVQALARLERHPEVDVIICGRGGGSLEDLWAFNDEQVVRALVRCRVPVVSAVGHETDTTLADFAADVRAKTPTAAGEMVVPELEVLEEDLRRGRKRLGQLIEQALAGARDRLAGLQHHRALAGPGHQIDLRRQRLDELRTRLIEAADYRLASLRQDLDRRALLLHTHQPLRAVASLRERHAAAAERLAQGLAVRLARAQERLAHGAAQLHALSPLAVVARGYAIVLGPDGTLVRSVAQVRPGAAIRARVADGTIAATVAAVQPLAAEPPRAPDAS